MRRNKSGGEDVGMDGNEMGGAGSERVVDGEKIGREVREKK